MRNRPERATWLKGYQSKALFDNAEHARKPVISIFSELKNKDVAGRCQLFWVRDMHEKNNGGWDRV